MNVLVRGVSEADAKARAKPRAAEDADADPELEERSEEEGSRPWRKKVAWAGAIVALLIHDRVTTGRFHPATMWGGAFLVASQGLRLVIAGTDGWLSVAHWIGA